MLRLLYRLFNFLTVLSLLWAALFPPSLSAAPLSEFEALVYPAQAVFYPQDVGLTEKQWCSRANPGEEYTANRGWQDINGVIRTHAYTAQINGEEVPVYGTAVFIGSTQKGAVHCFSEIFVPQDAPIHLRIKLQSGKMRLHNALVLPSAAGIHPQCRRGVVTADVTACGSFTFLFNNASQCYAYTLFVRPQTDEQAQIDAYRARYGAQNVTIFSPGVHMLDYIHLQDAEGQVLYLCRGAYLIAAHRYAIQSAQDELRCTEPDATESNGIGLTRFPFLNVYRCRDVHVVGSGVIDLSGLDRRERRGVVFSDCTQVELRGVRIVNAPEWSCIFYACRSVHVDKTDIFGYRLNSDAFAVCNSTHVLVEDCFARSGDDLFEVKTLGGTMDCESVTFRRCMAWGGKARCFGVTGEVLRAIRDVTFCDCAVLWRDATWDNDRICSLAVIVEDSGGCVENVTFENIEIFRDDGRAIGCILYGENVHNFEVQNVRFRNIRCASALPIKIVTNGREGCTMHVTLENVTVNGSDAVRNVRRTLQTDGGAQVQWV